MEIKTSWLESANHPQTDFPLENLPFGVFRGDRGVASIGIAIGDCILNLRALAETDLLQGLSVEIVEGCRRPSLNALMAFGNEAAMALRRRAAELLSFEEYRSRVEPLLMPRPQAEMLLPVEIGDYTDFYASVHHATNVGRLFRPDNPLLPNYRHLPVGYHGRASSIVISGTEIRRPHGQIKPAGAAAPVFGSSTRLDYELETGFFIGRGNSLGEPVPITQAEDHIFGFCLVNDWSARDIQSWEYQPLGPFLAKSFATTISPWVITMDALRPFRVAPVPRPEDAPQSLPYLIAERDQARGMIDLKLEVWLETERMRRAGEEAVRLSHGNFHDLYWTPAQMLAHHTSNGCNLRSGDLLASGTISGAEAGSQGCLLEITQGGAQPLYLPNGEERRFLEDGDEIILRGYCEREGHRRIGFGECRGRVRCEHSSESEPHL
jgi:fumarylacetoacetase